MCSLQDILYELEKPNNLPAALPLIHVSKSGKSGFEKIIYELKLSPSPDPCEIFNQHLLYFSYGSVFYATGEQAAKDQTKFPICFLFNPQALSIINNYYPYDTGAAFYDKYGRHSKHLKENFNKYKVLGSDNDIESLLKLVYHLYETNIDYIQGKIQSQLEPRLCELLPKLFDFFQDNIEGCDRRQYTIECQTTQHINLNEYLDWIAYPKIYSDLYHKLFEEMQPSPPVRYPYDTGTINHPREIIGDIRKEAQKYIKNRFFTNV